MADHAPTIDATGMPDVVRLVREVNRTGRSQLLQAGDELARISPAKRTRRQPIRTPQQRERILRATFGAWKGLVDPDQLKQELAELQRDDVPPRSL